MNETLTVFMISEIERLREEGREPARRIYHNMLRTLCYVIFNITVQMLSIKLCNLYCSYSWYLIS